MTTILKIKKGGIYLDIIPFETGVRSTAETCSAAGK